MLEVSVATHQGKVRQSQQDDFRVVDLPDGGVVLVLADGMGGPPAGDVAARLAVTRVAEHFTRNVPTPGSIKWELSLALDVAARSVWSAGELPSQQGTGTTLEVAVVFPDGTAHLAHIGDSRIYLLTAGSIRQVTTDHENQRGQLTSWLGGSPNPPRVDRQSIRLAVGQDLLLCSDGLFLHLRDKDIHRLIRDGDDFGNAAQRAVMAAVEAGGRDNVTVLAVRMGVGSTEPVGGGAGA